MCSTETNKILNSSSDLRRKFIEYFKEKGHTQVAPGSLIPVGDASLLFTNAGMVQFKDVFLGLEQRAYTKAVTAQPCVRAGGKHNDLDNVGYTARHHTFFEMLGNFSFGDYFKRDAIHYAWEFLTDCLAIPAEKLWITVFEDDKEAERIWLEEINISDKRFSRCGAASNFWMMGDTGPCGPCSEIFYDHGDAVEGGPPGSPDENGDRYVEIWNLVFMEYEQSSDGTRTRLPKPSVDTGMGLERLTAVMQGKINNYDTDLFDGLIKTVEALYFEIHNREDIDLWNYQRNYQRLRSKVIADHIRSSAFLIMHGITPSNEGRGYVLRRIIRRAVRHGDKFKLPNPFFYRLVKPLIEIMGDAYPELAQAQTQIENTLREEEIAFRLTLEKGKAFYQQAVEKLTSTGKMPRQEWGERADDKIILPGDVIFKLYDTYGFPPDLTADLAREINLNIDQDGFNKLMEVQRQRSRAVSHFASNNIQHLNFPDTVFEGYTLLENEAVVLGLIKNDIAVEYLNESEEGIVILNKTPFYAESGGQVGDKGRLFQVHGETVDFIVRDTTKIHKVFLHKGIVKSGRLQLQMKLRAQVDKFNRVNTMLNHSATHLLHTALREILGQQLMQRGSLVEAERLRFDFTYSKPISLADIRRLEQRVNEEIRSNLLIDTKIMTLDDAKQKGALAFFDEKYDEQVRVLTIGNFSKELCGGTHVARTGDIGLFKILSESSIASGVRRLEAVTGQYALNWIHNLENQLETIALECKTNRTDILQNIKKNMEKTRYLSEEIAKLQYEKIQAIAEQLIKNASFINEVFVVIGELNDFDISILKMLVDQLKTKLNTAVIVLSSINKTRVQVVSSVTKNLSHRIKAKDLIKGIAKHIDGKGGGSADFAQASGIYTPKLSCALKSARLWIESQINI